MWIRLLCLAALAVCVKGAGAGAARLVCYVESARAADGFSECTHLVYAGNARGDKLDILLKDYRKNNPKLKIVLRVTEADKDLRTLLKSKYIQGLELSDVHRFLNKTKVLENVEAARKAVSSSGGGPLFLALPTHPELLAKYYDLRQLMKKVDLLMVQTHALGLVKKMTYHPSRLSGLWDMMNTDSVVDLVVGLGVPASKIVISLPATARQFTLQNETLSTPGSPTTEDDPKEIDQAELCRMLQRGRWTLERDQDLSAPYAFKNKTWVSFEDSSSVDVKGKYARVRGLAGLALHKADHDIDTPCGPTLKSSLAKVLNQQSRAPRAAVLRSLEHEILSAPGHARVLDALQVSPYRITQVVDSDGVIHSIREDTRTEFSCSRQGYFVHPRSCARFYRCVKFDQLSPDYTVFEFDCPAGLAFDSRYEVCVWPGSLPHSQACPGSSEIAPVPQTRFVCPEHEGYYVDPENCRWFFACIDHGKSPLSAYEFRCPFGLGFDPEKLKCDWPWLVPACGNIGRYEASTYGFSAATLTGAVGFQGQTADAINVAAHNSLISGASLDNLVGIQGGFLTKSDALDNNFITSQELAAGAGISGQAYQIGHGTSSLSGSYKAGQTASGISKAANGGSFNIVHDSSKISQGSGATGLLYQNGVGTVNANLGLVQATKYDDEGKYNTGSLILDDYRLPNGAASNVNNADAHIEGAAVYQGSGIGSVGQTTLHQINAAASLGQTNVHQSRVVGTGQTTLQQSGNAVNLGSATFQKSEGIVGLGQATLLRDSGQYTKDYLASGQYTKGPGAYSTSTFTSGSSGKSNQYSGASYNDDNSGAYIHDPSGDYAEPYKHIESPDVPYLHSDSGYKQSSDYYDYGRYSGSSQESFKGKYTEDNNGQYIHDNSGVYVQTGSFNGGSSAYDTGSYTTDYSGSYKQDDTGKYVAGIYNGVENGKVSSSVNGQQYHGSYGNINTGKYISDSTAYTGASHTLTAGAVNVGLVGNTTLVDADYSNQYNYQPANGAYNTDTNYKSYNYDSSIVHHTLQPGHVSLVSQPAVSINHIGTDSHNLDGYSFVTTPTSSGIPTTATPFAVTTALPAITTYKTTFTPEAPKSTIKEIFGYKQPAVTSVQPTVIAVKQQYVTPSVQVTDYNQGLNYQYENRDYSLNNNAASITANQAANVKTETSGYDYSKPSVQFENGVSYTTTAPVVSVSTYRPQGFSHSQQTLHKVESVGFEYSPPTPVSEEPFKKLVAYTTGPSITTFAQPTVSTYTAPQSYTHQTVHKLQTSKVADYAPAVEIGSDIGTGYENIKSNVAYERPETVLQYTAAQPVVQPVVSTYQPQVYSQQTLHKVDASQVNTYSQGADSLGYEYPKPTVKFEESPKVAIYSTPAPVILSTPAPIVSSYKPQYYSHQTIHKVETQNVPVSSTAYPSVVLTHQQPAVSTYENPILKYTQKVTPVTYVKPTTPVFTESYQPVVQRHRVSHIRQPTIQQEISTVQQSYNTQQLQSAQGYSYSQPEIQRDVETLNNAKSYSDASVVSHQIFHLSNSNSQYESGREKDAVFVSTTPSTLAYEEHYGEYETPKKVSTYKAPEYIPPKAESRHSYSVSTASIPVIQQQNSVVYQTNDQYDYKPAEYSQQYESVQNTVPAQVSFSTSHIEEPKRVESVHFSSFPGTTVTTKYKQAQVAYQSPEIQVAYKAEEYLPPVVPSVTPAVTTVVPIITSTYRPRVYSTVSTTREYLPPSAEPNYSTPEYISPKIENVYLPPSTTVRPVFKSTTQIPTYVESTTSYKAPEYLPPAEEPNQKVINFESFGFKNIGETSASKISYNPYQEYVVAKDTPAVLSTTSIPIQRKQNIVVETAKNLLGFGTVGPDAGLVSRGTYTTSAPVVVSSSERYLLSPKTVTSTYAPIKQELIEVIPSTSPSFENRRSRPKVAVVTKINDFNPLLVRKLGAVCSCQSPVLILKGKRPNVSTPQDFDDYSNDYDNFNHGDVDNGQYSRKSSRLQTPVIKTVTVAPVDTSTSNPIIVPDDSYYQDYQEPSNFKVDITPKSKEIYSESYVSSTAAPIGYSTTEKINRIRPRVNAVTPAPTYQTMLLNQEVTPRIILKESRVEASAIDSQAFDRYGPGGWRSRDETLQGSVDCQRAGLFRHPKQCNKFYACRWDCTKQRFTLHVFNCPVQLSFDPNIGACNWPSQGPTCQGDTLLTNTL